MKKSKGNNRRENNIWNKWRPIFYVGKEVLQMQKMDEYTEKYRLNKYEKTAYL